MKRSFMLFVVVSLQLGSITLSKNKSDWAECPFAFLCILRF